MAIDSIGQDDTGGPILFSKYHDALDQLDKNKSNLKKFLSANIDLSVLKTLHPIELEFERRADGKNHRLCLLNAKITWKREDDDKNPKRNTIIKREYRNISRKVPRQF